MSPHAYTEDQLVEQPAIGLFATLTKDLLRYLVNFSRREPIPAVGIITL